MKKKKPGNKVLEILNELGSIPDTSYDPHLKADRVVMSQEQGKARQAPQRGPCGKMTFTSEAKAKQAMRSRLKRGANTSRMRTYFCKTCLRWHMSSSFRDN